MKPLRLVFMGSPEVAVTILKGLLNAGHTIVCVITQPDKPAGRGQKTFAPPVKTFALEQNLNVYQPEDLKVPDFLSKLETLKADAIVVAAYGKILPKALLERYPSCFNVHFSLLPKYRGASCVASALLAGDKEAGVTIMQVVQKLDAGPILRQKRLAIGKHETTGLLEARLADASVDLLLNTLQAFQEGTLTPVLQNEDEVSFAPRIEKQAAKIDWTKEASEIDRLIRAMHPWPVAYTFLGEERIQIHEAMLLDQTPNRASIENQVPGTLFKTENGELGVLCQKGALKILTVQPASKKKIAAMDWLKGKQKELPSGMRFL